MLTVDERLPRHWLVVAVKDKTPEINGPGWQRKAVPAGQAGARFPRAADGLGLLLGPRSGVIDVEEDAPEAERRLAELVGEEAPVTPCWASTRGKHRLFQWDAALAACPAKVDLGRGLEARLHNVQSVLPPADGRRWLVPPDECPPAELPPALRDAILAAGHRDKPATRLTGGNGQAIPAGQRNATLTSLAGSMRRRGATPEAIDAALHRENAARCKPPLPEREVAAIAKSIARYEPAGDPAHLTDTGNAERFAQQHRDTVRFCHPWSKWLVWDGIRWKIDDTGQVDRLAKATTRAIYGEAAACPDEKQRKALADHAKRTESASRRAAMLQLARAEDGIPVLPDDLDRGPWLLNVQNGTIDLRTGELRPHRRKDMITKLAPVEYPDEPGVDCPAWTGALHTIFNGDAELVGFVQRFLGYCLTGDVREQALPIWWGAGSNGKSTLLTAVQEILGDYAGRAPAELLLAKRGDQHPTMLANLAGKRLVVCQETGDGRRLAEGLLKELTGGDPIPARRMREDYWEFMPTHKLILATNHKPAVRGTDHAIWRRLLLLPFTLRFWDPAKGESGPPELEADKTLPDRLRAEHPAILRWLVTGCLAWQRDGLAIPDSVRAATKTYQAEQDAIGRWLAECCTIGPDHVTPAKSLYESYKQWCETNDEDPISQRAFGGRLTERGFGRDRGTGNVHFRTGLRLESDPK